MDDYTKMLFQKFINEECSLEEVKQLFQHLQDSEEDAKYKELMDNVWLGIKDYPLTNQVDKERQFESILNRSKKYHKGKVRPIFGKYRIYMAAASFGLILVSALVYLLVFQSSVVTYQTEYGETMEIALPDGSDVILNNNSTLSYNQDWKRQHIRKVFLRGEAFFSVVHTKDDRKFMVNTPDDLNVEVLGTRFNVYNRRKTTEVVLNEGKVKVNINTVENENQEVLMEPGDLVAYSQTTRQYQKKLIDTKIYTSWKDSIFVFEDQPLQEIALTLEDNYGYAIHFVDEKIGSYRFTGTIPTNKMDILFTMLRKSFDLKIEKKEDEIWIDHNNNQ